MDTITTKDGVRIFYKDWGHHYSVARGETVVAVTFIGPYTITYVNAYEAPRQRSFPFGY